MSVAKPQDEPSVPIYSPDEALRRARPLPRYEDLVVEDLSDEEWIGFQEALVEA